MAPPSGVNRWIEVKPFARRDDDRRLSDQREPDVSDDSSCWSGTRMGRPLKQTSLTRLSSRLRATKWTWTLAGPRSNTSAAKPSVGVAATSRMKKPEHDAVTAPPSVENVAVGSGGGAVDGGVEMAGTAVVVVVDGTGGGRVVAGSGDGPGSGAGGVVGLGRGGAVDGGVGVMVVGTVRASGVSSARAWATSRGAITDGGRSVTSPATTDVAAHAMAVAAAVVVSQIPAVTNRRTCTTGGCPRSAGGGIRDR